MPIFTPQCSIFPRRLTPEGSSCCDGPPSLFFSSRLCSVGRPSQPCYCAYVYALSGDLAQNNLLEGRETETFERVTRHPKRDIQYFLVFNQVPAI